MYVCSPTNSMTTCRPASVLLLIYAFLGHVYSLPSTQCFIIIIIMNLLRTHNDKVVQLRDLYTQSQSCTIIRFINANVRLNITLLFRNLNGELIKQTLKINILIL